MVKIRNLNIIFIGISAGTTRYRPQIKFSTTCDSINYRFSLNKPLDDRDPRLVWPGRDITSVAHLSNPDRPPPTPTTAGKYHVYPTNAVRYE